VKPILKTNGRAIHIADRDELLIRELTEIKYKMMDQMCKHLDSIEKEYFDGKVKINETSKDVMDLK
jgi:hypothetical protein